MKKFLVFLDDGYDSASGWEAILGGSDNAQSFDSKEEAITAGREHILKSRGNESTSKRMVSGSHSLSHGFHVVDLHTGVIVCAEYLESDYVKSLDEAS